FYRWAQLLPNLQPIAMDAPAALCVGDLHVANFGTWRDADGRLVCGVNDFDEGFELPYTSALLRLVASGVVAVSDRGPGLRRVCEAVLDGYSRGIRARLDGTAEPTV